jgi:nucleoside-diphosphate kinase
MEPLIHHLMNLIPGWFTFAMIKPDGYPYKDEIMQMIWKRGLHLTLSERVLTEIDIRALYYSHIGRAYYDRNGAHNMSGPVLVLAIEGENALSIWRDELLPAIRAKWASTDPEKRHCNVVHGADSPEAAFREAQYFFS